REPRRRVAIGCLEPALELAPKLGRRGGEPAPDERRLAGDRGVVPQPAAEQMHLRRADAGLLQTAGDLLQLFAAFGQQQSIEAGPGARRRCERGTWRSGRWGIA